MTLSDKTQRLIVAAAVSIWDEIGYDCLDAMALSGFKKPRDINTITLPRSQVIELVLDASRLEERLRDEHRNRPNPELVEFLAVWTDYRHIRNGQARTQLMALMRRAFPYSRYGM